MPRWQIPFTWFVSVPLEPPPVLRKSGPAAVVMEVRQQTASSRKVMGEGKVLCMAVCVRS